MPSLDRQMNNLERSLWSLWLLSLLSQSLFLWTTQTMHSGSSIIWAAGAIVLVVTVLVVSVTMVTIIVWPRWREVLMSLLFAGVLPGCGLALLHWKDATWIVSWAAFEALGAGLMFAWLVFDAFWLKPWPDTVRFSDVVADAKRNAGES